MAYVKYSLQYRQLGWVGDPLENLSIHLYCDADFAGCTETKRSTSGVHTVIMGPFTCFPINGQSKRQGSVSHSTPEAEIVSADTAIFREGIPALDLWQVLTGREHVSCTLHEDNETMIRVMQTGRNPTMRHLNRTHGVDISGMKEQIERRLIDVKYTQTDRQCADIHTKAFDNKDKWNWAMNQINVFDLSSFDIAAVNSQRQLPSADPKVPKVAAPAVRKDYQSISTIIQDPLMGPGW